VATAVPPCAECGVAMLTALHHAGGCGCVPQVMYIG
jgi:hypothetical protein